MKRKVNRSENEIVIVEEEGQEKTMPTIQIKCPKCENNLAIWWLRQLRAADESEVRFFRCTECGHTWRQYRLNFFPYLSVLKLCPNGIHGIRIIIPLI